MDTVYMSSSQICRTFQDFRGADGPCKSLDDKFSRRVPSSQSDHFIADVFTALDDIDFNPQFITLQDPLEKSHQSIHEPKDSKHTTRLDNTACSDTAARDEALNQNVSYLSSSSSESEGRFCDIHTHDNERFFVAMTNHHNLRHDVQNWLSKLPDLLATSGPSSKEEANLYDEGIPMLKSEHPEDLGLFNETPSPSTTTTKCEESDGMYKSLQGNKSPKHGAPASHGGVLDSYHSALLHIHSISTPIDHARSSLRPSMRRHYPRGLEREVREARSEISKRRED